MDANLEHALFNIGARWPHLRYLAVRAIKGDKQALNTIRTSVTSFDGLNGPQITALTARIFVDVD